MRRHASGVRLANLAVRRGMAVLLTLAVMTLSIGPAYGASRKMPDPIKSHGKVKKLGVGQHVFVKLSNGTKIRGHIVGLGEDSFTLKPDKRTDTMQIAYAEVLKVRENPGPLFWMAIGAAVVIIIIVAAR